MSVLGTPQTSPLHLDLSLFLTENYKPESCLLFNTILGSGVFLPESHLTDPVQPHKALYFIIIRSGRFYMKTTFP